MIRITRKRVIVTAVLLALLGGVLVITWRVCDWPPLRLMLKYGISPAGGPTGRKISLGGVNFIQLSPGYLRVGSHGGCDAPSAMGRLFATLGLPWGEQGEHLGSACPPHWAEVGESIWVSSTEVTRAQYARILGVLPPSPTDSELPATGITWDAAVKFCAAFGAKFGLPVRLPREVEWEYACRAGSSSTYSFGNSPVMLAEYAWSRSNAGGRAHSVGSRSPNRWGLFDMHGNVWEWCQDVWTDSYSQAERPPEHSDGRGLGHVIRGGGFGDAAGFCTSAIRQPESRAVKVVGFRLVMTSGPEVSRHWRTASSGPHDVSK